MNHTENQDKLDCATRSRIHADDFGMPTDLATSMTRHSLMELALFLAITGLMFLIVGSVKGCAA